MALGWKKAKFKTNTRSHKFNWVISVSLMLFLGNSILWLHFLLYYWLEMTLECLRVNIKKIWTKLKNGHYIQTTKIWPKSSWAPGSASSEGLFASILDTKKLELKTQWESQKMALKFHPILPWGSVLKSSWWYIFL